MTEIRIGLIFRNGIPVMCQMSKFDTVLDYFYISKPTIQVNADIKSGTAVLVCHQLHADHIYKPLLLYKLFWPSGPPKNSHFLIPLVESLLLVIRRYCIQDFSLAPKLSEKDSRADLGMHMAGGYIFASTTRQKKRVLALIPPV